jgi:heme-degrading monooxygenase HmoA
MVIELATFHVVSGKEDEFALAYSTARPLLVGSAGCAGAVMHRVHEDKSTFVLLVEWERIEDHLEGFRRSNAYAQWRSLISPFFDGDPLVIHLSSL